MGTSSIAGGLGSIVLGPSVANGIYAVAIGVQNRANSTGSVAIGKNAWAERAGSVVIGDGCALSSNDSVRDTANNQFVVRGCGGIKMFTSMNLSSGVEVAAGGSSWSSVSDVARKEHFADVDPLEVLDRLSAMPIYTWNYKTQDATIRHMGPTAQDFRAAFGLGENDTTINTIDADGAALAAVQGLHVLVRQQQAMIDQLKAEVDQLKRTR